MASSSPAQSPPASSIPSSPSAVLFEFKRDSDGRWQPLPRVPAEISTTLPLSPPSSVCYLPRHGGNHSPLSDFDGDERLESSINILQINHSSVSKYVFLQLESSVRNYFAILYLDNNMKYGMIWLLESYG
ncbi:hypothetical protein CK203_071804 [Vitis vinifera]|uniref:Uncharacterized protein n=1 Tax=Vitis vinifera TaxID=29760 RepID=A0A438C3F9_VITVI|nr:hypothetical protein CK203_071804 [Vitis vinifera]